MGGWAAVVLGRPGRGSSTVVWLPLADMAGASAGPHAGGPRRRGPIAWQPGRGAQAVEVYRRVAVVRRQKVSGGR
ncbi:hypothetical protein GCM10010276_05060 [Streptomyces longisporus]|uniref:Uncharacterized protein n=1 Tax=Streptomyces longisporus TaxID=1948 RepID=A0ABN3KW33_STRLO